MTNVTRMQEITNEINARLDNIQTESMLVGQLLAEALNEIKEQGGKQSDFVDYCKLEFGLSKSQAYKLIKINQVFGEDVRFKGVAMRVLYALSTQATEEEIEKAAEFAANGTLNTAIVNQLLNPVPAQPEKEEPPVITEDTKLTEEQDKALHEALDNVVDAPEAPQTTEEVINSADEATKQVIEGQKSEISTLKSMITTLQETISKLQDATKKKPVAPSLPQFKSACPYAVLGLSQTEATKKTRVTKAFRELIACGYGDGHESFELLVKAKDQLLADIADAK